MIGEGSLGKRIPSRRLRKCKETARSSGEESTAVRECKSKDLCLRRA